jgi:hypothetical protein
MYTCLMFQSYQTQTVVSNSMQHLYTNYGFIIAI